MPQRRRPRRVCVVGVDGGDGDSWAVPRPCLPSGGPLAVRVAARLGGCALARARGGRGPGAPLPGDDLDEGAVIPAV
ncbi:hypothetical protein O4J56_31255, partial [Nocardiopsis sp. RSe5-2]